MSEDLYISFEKEEADLFRIIGKEAANLDTRAFVIGGFVRDKILGRPTKDADVVCEGSGIELAQAVAKTLGPHVHVVTYSRFGTAMIKWGDLETEFVGARRESYSPDSRKPVVEEGTLEEDQNRRDFTINAMAASLQQKDFGKVFDPFEGLDDLDRCLIRTPLEPANTFSDDPLRMMRAVRFASQLRFKIVPETLEGITQSAHRLEIISMERIMAEFNKILASEKPSIGLGLLFTTGLLDHFFPELVDLHGVETIDGLGHKDNFYHTLQVVDNVAKHSDSLWLRWGALLHDIGKPPTRKFVKGQGWTFHGHEVVGARMVKRIFKRFKLPLDQKLKLVEKLVLLHLRPIPLSKNEITDSAIRRLLYDAGDDLEDLLILCEADITSKNPRKVDRFLQNYQMVRQKLVEVEEKDRIRNWQPPISGEEVMLAFAIPPSREVGIIKTAIKEAILDGEIPNEKEAAYQFMLEQGKSLGLVSVANSRESGL